MTDEQLDEFLAELDGVAESLKNDIRRRRPLERDNLWRSVDRRLRLRKARKPLAEADQTLKANLIFFPDHLRVEFQREIALIWDALSKFEVGTDPRAEDYSLVTAAWKLLDGEGKALHEQLAKAVRARLIDQTQLAQERREALG